MIAVIVNHVAIPSFYHLFSVEGLGLVSGAEGFVLFSGTMVGLVYGRRMLRDGWLFTAKKLWARSARLYLIALITALAVYLLQFVSIIDMSPLTAYRDPRTGRIFSLYGDSPSLGTFALNMATLSYGPGQINILGLYVVLLAVAPLILLSLRGRGWPVVMAVSCIIYVWQLFRPTRVLPAQSENSFTILSWQALFVSGLLAGYYRDRIKSIYRGRYGTLCGWAIVAVAVGLWLLALNHPGHEMPGRIRLRWIPESTFYWLYQHFFERIVLGPGRFLNILALAGTLYLFLIRFRHPIRLAGWLLIPIGRATLAVFIIHLVFVVAAHNMGLLQRNNLWVNTLAHTGVILAIALMIRNRALMRLLH